MNYIAQARIEDGVKEVPDIIEGRPIVLPAGPYFAEATASLAEQARGEAIDAGEKAAAAILQRAARRILERIRKSKEDSVEPSATTPDATAVTGTTGAKRGAYPHKDNAKGEDAATSSVEATDDILGEAEAEDDEAVAPVEAKVR